MTIYEFITTCNKPDIARVLSACGYAIKENISLFLALKEMDFFLKEEHQQIQDISDELIRDISDEFELSRLSVFCGTQLMTTTSGVKKL